MTRRGNRRTDGPPPTPHEPREVSPLARVAREGPETVSESAPEQLAAHDLSGASPDASPASYGALLRHLGGSPWLQTGILRRLQRSYGNSFVGRALRARLDTARPAPQHEREADDAARQLTHTQPPSTATPREAPAQQSGDTSSAQTLNDSATHGLEQRLQHRRGGGSPLPDEVRASMEAGMGADLSDVRVHTDGEAGRLNRDLHARAFTEGRDIYFGGGEYDPASDEGRRLLAHELAHVVQQSGNAAPEAIQREPEQPQQQSAPKQDPMWEVMSLMDDPLWANDGRAFHVLNFLEINHLLQTLQALRNGGYLARLTLSLGMATGIDQNRLETATQAVAAKGMKTTPEAFALEHRERLEKINLDQRLAILRYLGPVPSEPLGEVVKLRDIVYVVVENEVRFGAEGEKTKTWRTNNPGALTVPQAGQAVSQREKRVKEALLERLQRNRAYTDTTNPHGYKYDEFEGGARLAVFPTEREGRAALRDKLRAFQEAGSTLEGFGASQLGSVAAGAGYAQLMVKILRDKLNSPYRNITVETRMSQINLDDLVEVTQRREGWNPEDKGQLVRWADTAGLQTLPAPVQFRVLLAQWNLASKKK